MILSCLEAIVCTPYSQAKSKSEISQEFSQLKSIERGPWQKLGVRHMTQNKRNKIVFVHEQVIICDHYSNSNFYKKLRKLNIGSMVGITFLFHWILEIAGTRFKMKNN